MTHAKIVACVHIAAYAKIGLVLTHCAKMPHHNMLRVVMLAAACPDSCCMVGAAATATPLLV